MSEKYFNLKHKLEELGYNYPLPVEAVPLVECVIADLLQTTRSLRHYMDLSKEAILQRDSLMMEAEPYKKDNVRLIHENNKFHKELMLLKEDNLKIAKESKRKLKAISEQLVNKENQIIKLQHDIRDLNLRGLCADTLSSRNKSKRKDCGDNIIKVCTCDKSENNDNIELVSKIHALEESNQQYIDEITILKSQVEHRDNEIIRLNILLEGGRTLNKDICCKDVKAHELQKKLLDAENANDILQQQLDKSLEKQHEAMLHALTLADKTKRLEDELHKTDSLALKVEEDCNKKLSVLINEVKNLQHKIEDLVKKNKILEKELIESQRQNNSSCSRNFDDLMNENIKVKLQSEVKELSELNKTLQEKLMALSEANKEYFNKQWSADENRNKLYPTKDELQILLESERKKYERYVSNVQEKITETIDLFNRQMSKCNNKEKHTDTHSSTFIRDLQIKLCENEQKLLMMKKENNELLTKLHDTNDNNRKSYKDTIRQLNDENAQLSRENIDLSQKLSHYKNICSSRPVERDDYAKKDYENHRKEIDKLNSDIYLLKKDKQEYNNRYKEAMNLVEKLKRDLALKEREIEQIQEENNSYKMTHRTGKASADHLKEECYLLREQIKKMQSDVIKEKTLANQMKNIQLETERSSNEIQNEIICLQRKQSLLKDTIEKLENKCKELHSEISSLKCEKNNLIENLKTVDQERDKLVIQLDHKTEENCILEQKLKTQTYEISKLQNDVSDLKRQLNINKVTEHKLHDNETQIRFLNTELARITQQYDDAIIENKHLQNKLADANGTLKVTRIEYDKSCKEVDELRQQLQHYVAEIRRIEELLSHKEAERSDMLEHFASLSVEANILENTNHSLESESASKSLQLQHYVIKIQDLESKLLDKESLIETQSTRIVDLTCKINSLESEIKLISEEKITLEQNVAHLKQMCNNLQSDQKLTGDIDSELKLYETRIHTLSNVKSNLELENRELRDNLKTTEKLLSNARKEIIDLKLALQDATSETKSLQNQIGSLSRREVEVHENTLTREEFEYPLLFEETIHEVSHEEDDIGRSTYRDIQKRLSKFGHGSTL